MRLVKLLTILLWPIAIFAQSGVGAGGQSNVSGGGVSGTIVAPNQNMFYVAQVCGTQPNCFTADGNGATDNATVFTNLFSAVNTSKWVGAPIDPRTVPQVGSTPCCSAKTATVNATNYPGDTTLVFVVDSNGSAFTVTDPSSLNTYTQLGSAYSPSGAGVIQLFQVPNATGVYNSITATESGANEFVGVSTISLPSVASISSATTNNTGSPGTTATISVTTSQANTMVLALCSWFKAATTVTLTSTAGTNRTNSASSSSAVGFAMWGTFAATAGTVVTSGGTLNSASTSWGCEAVQILPGGNGTLATPTVYFGNGYYYYSGGINPTIPMRIECAPNTFLHYIGTADAVDIGPLGGYANGLGSSAPPYIIDGCTFTGGSRMTNGIVLQKLASEVGIRNNNFIDFGNASSYMISGTCDNYDIEIGPQNRFQTDDLQVRNFVQINSTGCDFNSFVRIHDNVAYCYTGRSISNVAIGCSAAQGGIGFVIDSLHSRFYHNNIAFMNPDVWLRCTNTPCTGNSVDDNQMESAYTAGTGTPVPPIQFSGGQERLMVSHNSVFLHSLVSLIGPRTGTDTLTGAQIAWNQIGQIALATPVVTLNNIAGNTANQAWQNLCSTGLSGHVPCALLHTVGGNINQWNPDYFIALSYSAATTASYTFSQTYNSAPKCTLGPVVPGTTTFTITTLNTTTLTVTASASFTGTVDVFCSAGDGQ